MGLGRALPFELPPDLLAADEAVYTAAEPFLEALNELPCPEGFWQLQHRLDAARQLLDRLDAEPITGCHLQASWAAVETVARFRFRWPEVPVSQVIESVHGPGSGSRLDGMIAGLDHSSAWRLVVLQTACREGGVPAEAPHYRDTLEKATARLASAFRQWLEGHEGALPGLDAEVILGPPGLDRSFYQLPSHRVVLRPLDFLVLRDDSGVTVKPISALLALAHELAGHAVHDAASRGLPPPFRPDHRVPLRFANQPAAEGFAMYRMGLAVTFAREHLDELSFGESDLELLELMADAAVVQHAVAAWIGALTIRASQEPGFDPVAEAAKIAGHSGFGERIARTPPGAVTQLLYDAACCLGTDMVEQTAGRLNSRGVNSEDAWKYLATGSWAPLCYSAAVMT